MQEKLCILKALCSSVRYEGIFVDKISLLIWRRDKMTDQATKKSGLITKRS